MPESFFPVYWTDPCADTLWSELETNESLPWRIKRMGIMSIILLMAQGIELALKSLKHAFDGLPPRRGSCGHSLEVLWEDLKSVQGGELRNSIRSYYKDFCQENPNRSEASFSVVMKAYNDASIASRYFLDGTYNSDLSKMAKEGSMLLLLYAFRAVQHTYLELVIKGDGDD